MHPITLLVLVLLGAVALTQLPSRVAPPDLPSADAAPVETTAMAEAAEPLDAGVVATPNHDPLRARRVPTAILETAVPEAPVPEATIPETAAPAAVATVATPNHDVRPLSPLPDLALNASPLRAEPEPPAPSAPAFVATDTVLYAKGGARLRAGPGTAADVLTKLAADTPLRAVARSSDSAWWRVSLAGGHVGYVHRSAVTQNRAVNPKPPAASPPVIAAAAPQSTTARRNQGLRSYVDETMNWFIDAAARGTAPTVLRTER